MRLVLPLSFAAAILCLDGALAGGVQSGTRPNASQEAVRGATGERYVGTMRQSGLLVGDAYPMVLRLTDSGGETEYPSHRCSGRLTPIGVALGHRIFQETIVSGGVKERPADGCIDGIVMVRRDGDTAVVGWFVAGDGGPVQASATLYRERR